MMRNQVLGPNGSPAEGHSEYLLRLLRERQEELSCPKESGFGDLAQAILPIACGFALGTLFGLPLGLILG